jgi:hypothetical protein
MQEKILYLMMLIAIGSVALAASDVNQIEITGETTGQFTSPFMIPQGFAFSFNYLIATQAVISILDQTGTEVQRFEFKAEGVSIGEHKSFQLKKGDYTVKETYSVIASPDNPFFQGQDMEGEPQRFEWGFTASDDGTYDLSVSAVLTKLSIEVGGDLELKEIGEVAKSIPVKLATTRNIGAGEQITYTAKYTASLSKTSTVELVSKGEEEMVTFVVTGAVKERDGTVVPNAELTVELVSKGLSKVASTDEGGIYKATFVASKGTVLAQSGDTVKVSYESFSETYRLNDEDVSKARAVVNLTLEREPEVMLASVSPEKVKNGDVLSLTVIGEPGLTVEVDLSELDSTKPKPVTVPEVLPNVTGIYTADVTISPENTRENGRKRILFKITDRFGNTASRTAEVSLENPSPAQPPKIDEMIGPLKLVSSDPVTIWAVVGGDVTSVNAILKRPSGDEERIELSDPDGDGRYESEPVGLDRPGIYRISVVASGPGGKISTEEITINTAPWDINSDGRVDIFDLVLIGKNYGREVSSPQEDAWTADINSDGKVDILDLVLVGRHYGEQIGVGAPGSQRWCEGAVHAELQGDELRLDVPMWALVIPALDGKTTVRSGIAWVQVPDGTAAIGLGSPFRSLRLSGGPAVEGIELKGVKADGKPTMVKVIVHRTPSETRLLPNYPNPFNPETWIPFKLDREAEVRIRIYNTGGRLVRELILGKLPPGSYLDRSKAAYWDGRNLSGEPVSSGIYICQMIAGDRLFIGKMVLVK